MYEQRCQKSHAAGFIGPLRKNAECRTAKTSYPMNAGHINKLFYERDILVDKLKRRNDEITRLRAQLGGAAEPPSDSDSSASAADG